MSIQFFQKRNVDQNDRITRIRQQNNYTKKLFTESKFKCY